MVDSPAQRSESGHRATLWVMGRAGPLLFGVCRIGREIGHRMIAVGADFAETDAIPEEPWAQGIEWTGEPPDGPDPRAVIVTDRGALDESPSDLGVQAARVVRLAHHREDSEARLADVDSRTVVLQAPVTYDEEGQLLDQPAGSDEPNEPTDGPIPADQLAIALLRAALEPDHQGRLSAEEVAELGQAMYIK
jgi:hypothetical protein